MNEVLTELNNRTYKQMKHTHITCRNVSFNSL